MTDFHNYDIAAKFVADPTTSGDDLSTIAELQPKLQAEIANHPNAYPGLLNWLDTFGDRTVKAAVAARRRAEPEPAQWEPASSERPQWLDAPPIFASAPTQQPVPSAAYAPAPQQQMAPAAYVAPAPARRNWRLPVILGGVALLVAVALILTFAVFLPNRAAENKFNDAVAAFQQAQADLTTQVIVAQGVSNYATADTVDDPTTLDKLNADLQNAVQSTTAQVPAMAGGASAINQQVSDLQANTDTMRSLITTLQGDVAAVQASALSWATAALTSAISDANQTYSQYSYGDKTSLSALQDQITQSQAVLDGLSSADPSTYATIVQDNTVALQAAQDNVVSAAPIKCGDIILPRGVDPMVCKGMPSNAKTLSGSPYFVWFFQMPSKNVACDSDGSTVICEIQSYSWKTPTDLMTQCQQVGADVACNQNVFILDVDGSVSLGLFGGCDSPMCFILHGGTDFKPLTLQYGQVANFKAFACLSASDGVTCWNVKNHHGYKMNKTKFLYW